MKILDPKVHTKQSGDTHGWHRHGNGEYHHHGNTESQASKNSSVPMEFKIRQSDCKSVRLIGASTSVSSNAEVTETALKPGGVLYLDVPSGAAGDMLVAAFVDIGVPFEVFERALGALSLAGVTVEIRHAFVGTVAVKQCMVLEAEAPRYRDYRDIVQLLNETKLDENVRKFSLRIFEKLALAEAKVHGVKIESVHFHEVGAVDSIVDIVLVSAALAFLSPKRIVGSPLPVGRGWVNTQHGRLPLPAPATAICLIGLPIVPCSLEEELVTPTGAAILSSLCSEFGEFPEMRLEAVGHGAGSKSFSDRPNFLRIYYGQESVVRAGHEEAMLFSALVDDMTGEEAASALEQLLVLGALDVWWTTAMMKKGRPGLELHVLSRKEQLSDLQDRLFEMTSTIGMRVEKVSRRALPRITGKIKFEGRLLQAKASLLPQGQRRIKVERSELDKLSVESISSLALMRSVQALASSAESLDWTELQERSSRDEPWIE